MLELGLPGSALRWAMMAPASALACWLGSASAASRSTAMKVRPVRRSLRGQAALHVGRRLGACRRVTLKQAAGGGFSSQRSRSAGKPRPWGRRVRHSAKGRGAPEFGDHNLSRGI